MSQHERIMKRWDRWVSYYVNRSPGKIASWPRDEFEALIDDYDQLYQLAKEVADGNFNQAAVVAKAKELIDDGTR